MSSNKTASRKDDSKLRSKVIQPAVKDDAAKMTDNSAALQMSKGGDKKTSGSAPVAGKADGKKPAGNAGKSSGGSAGKSSTAR